MQRRYKIAIILALSTAISTGIFAATTSASEEAVKEANRAMNKYFSSIEAKNKKDIMDVIKDTRQGNSEEVIQQSIENVKGFKGKILNSEEVNDKKVIVTIEITEDGMDKYNVIDVPVVYEDGKWLVVLEETPNQRFDLERKK